MQLTLEELKSLSGLLLSTDNRNTQIAFEILGNQKLPKTLFTEVFIVFKLSEDQVLKEKAANFLYQQGVSRTAEIMTSDRRLGQKGKVIPTENTIKKNIDGYVQMSLGELDGMKMALAMYNKYNLGLKYLLDRLPIDLKKDLLKTFISGTTFKLNNCALTKIPVELYDFTDLTAIDLSGNKIKTISSKIKGLKNLESLNISNNNITKLNKVLSQLQELKWLDISNNDFIEFPTVICHLTKLAYLNTANFCRLFLAFPPEISQLKNIQEIKVSNVSYTGSSQHLGFNFAHFPSFTKLTSTDGQGINLDPIKLAEYAYKQNGCSEGVSYLFQHSKNSALIQQIIEEQFYDREQKTLDLKETLLVNFPKEIGHYAIEHINFSNSSLGFGHYRISSHPALFEQKPFDESFEILAQYKNVQSADLSKNQLTAIPGPMLHWQTLKTLNLANNELTNIDAILAHYPNLEKLDLSYNKLITLPAVISKLTKLKVLILTGNRFAEIPKEVGNLPSLVELRCANCLISNYNRQESHRIPDSWSKLKNLKKIYFYQGINNFKTSSRSRLEALLPEECEIHL